MSDRKGVSESSLLLTLEEISQLVSHSHDPGETLANIVRLIQGRFHTDVCSVYLLEPDRGELVLGATIGLRPESVGRVRMRLDEGLTGLAAEQMKPVMVADAFKHPRFKFFPEAGEDPYHSFLGVPLVEGGVLHGVLVVQTADPRTFSRSEVRMLVTVASQIAPLVSEAQLLERIVATAHEVAPSGAPASPFGAMVVRGTSLSPGAGVGEAYIVNGFDEWRRSLAVRSRDAAAEPARLARAMDAAREEIARASHRISSLVGEDHGAIMQAQLMILQDRKIEKDLRDHLVSGATAEAALLETLDSYVVAFEKLPSEYFQDRIFDIRDVFRRVLWHLQPWAAPAGPTAEAKRIILVARDVSVMELFSVDLDRLAGVVAEHGGLHSHAAILARSLGIPMVGQVSRLLDAIEPGQQLLVDASKGVVYVSPTPEQLAASTSRSSATTEVSPSQTPHRGPLHAAGRGRSVDRAECLRAAASASSGLPQIQANINLLCEVAAAIEQGAAGVGLYRTEFLFLARRTLPTEEEQVGTYRKLLTMLGGRPASIRTFDLRPDKMVHGSHLRATTTGPLDWRLVLGSPTLQQLFREQVRAIMRAATAGPARILVPLVTSTEQLGFVVDSLGRARDELTRDGLEFVSDVPLGVMIEVAAAAVMAADWAPQVNYFALGTNDLVASSLGIDRDDPAAATLNDPLHPAVLRTIHDVVAVAHAANRPVTVCGEMATDPHGALALAAFQVDALSVAVGQLRAALEARAAVSSDDLPRLGSVLLRGKTATEVRSTLREFSVGS
jgi:phosphotransferase system enzyme I (PtsP)